jgi:microcystin degradation protein MlrC
VVDQGLEDVAVFAVWDPEAVRIMAEVGVGCSITLELGGRTDMPSIGMKGEPLEVSGRVLHLSDGEFTAGGPMATGTTVRMGPSAVLDTGNSKIVIISRHVEPWDSGVFTSVGIDPKTTRYLLLKSRVHWRAGFGSIVKDTIPCDGYGVTSSEYELFEFNNLRRPIFPLDQFN